jgi:hypothetical protein
MFLHLQLKFNPASLARFVSSSVRVPLTDEFLSIYNRILSTRCLVSYCDKMMRAVRNEISFRPLYRQRALPRVTEIQTDWNISNITSDVIKNSDFSSIYQSTICHPATPTLRCFWKPGGLLECLRLLPSLTGPG